GRHHALGNLESDLAPLVDHPSGVVFVGLVDITVQQLKAEPLGLRLPQETPRLPPRRLDIGGKSGDLLQLLLGRSERRAGKDDAPNRVHIGDPGEFWRTVPAVDRQAQRAAHPGIVEWLSLVVGLDDPATVPVALLDGDLVAERADQLVAHRGRKAAELDRGAVAPDRLDPDRLLVGIDTDEAVEEGQSLLVIVGVFNSLDRLAGFDRGKFERARAQYVLLVPARIPLEDLLFVDEAEGVGERRKEGARREFE